MSVGKRRDLACTMRPWSIVIVVISSLGYSMPRVCRWLSSLLLVSLVDSCSSVITDLNVCKLVITIDSSRDPISSAMSVTKIIFGVLLTTEISAANLYPSSVNSNISSSSCSCLLFGFLPLRNKLIFLKSSTNLEVTWGSNE